MICKNCNSQVSERFKFCPECGEELTASGEGNSYSQNVEVIICENCGDENSAGNKFCQGCGSLLNGKTKRVNVQREALPKKSFQKTHGRKGHKTDKHSQVNNETKVALSVSQIYLVVGGILLIGFMLLYFSGVFESPKTDKTSYEQNNQNGPDLTSLAKINDLQSRSDANPSDLNLLLELAHTLHDNGFYERAISNYQKYIAVDSTKPEVIIDAGVCYFNLNKYDDAIEWISKGLKIKPDHLIGNYNMGIVNLSKGNKDEAVKWFNKVIELAPNSDQAKQAKELIESHL